MASVAEAVTAIAAATEQKEGWIRHLARRLQENGLVPIGSGAAPAAVRVEHVVSLLIALLSGAQLKNAAEAVRTYGALVEHGVDFAAIGMPEYFRPVQMTGRDIIEDALFTFASGDGEQAATVSTAQFTFVENWPEISVFYPRDGATVRYVRAGELPNHWQSDALRKSSTITGRAIERIVRDLKLTR